MLSLLKKLRRTARLIHPGSGPRSLYKRAKHCVRGLAWPAATAGWFEFLANPALAGVVRHSPRLYQKLQRPYLTSRLHTPQRLELLRQHYQFILRRCSPALIREIHSPAGKHLVRLPAADAHSYELRLMASGFDKEGELAVCLCGDCGVVLCTLSFTVARGAAGGSEIIIGGLQGNSLANDKQLIIALTRRWHGLRPKALLLFALHQLAAGWEVRRVRAVGDQTHIFRHWRKRKHIPSSYDAWWREAGGQLAEDGLFDLPARFVPRDPATLKVNKRPMYRHRYRMLADLAAQTAASLEFPPAAPAPLLDKEWNVAPLETGLHAVH
jgi:uncharacterized protein VirK/YbjX